MKKKDLYYLVLASVIFVVSGYVAYTQLVPKKPGSNVVKVEKIGAIPDHLDQAGLAQLNDAKKVQNYNSPVDLSGLGNTAVFGK